MLVSSTFVLSCSFLICSDDSIDDFSGESFKDFSGELVSMFSITWTKCEGNLSL